MLTHMDVLLEGYKLIQLSWITKKVGEDRARVRSRVNDPNILKELMHYRRDFECELICNRADRRVYQRNVPLQPLVTAHMVLGAKNPILIDDKNFPMNLEELTRKVGVPKTQYRLNYDAMLCFDAKQNFEEADQCVLPPPQLTQQVQAERHQHAHPARLGDAALARAGAAHHPHPAHPQVGRALLSAATDAARWSSSGRASTTRTRSSRPTCS